MTGVSSSKDGGGGRGVGGGHQPTGTGRSEGPRRWASEEPVLQPPETGQQTRTSPSPDSGKAWRSVDQTPQQQPQPQHRSDISPAQESADMATTRYLQVLSIVVRVKCKSLHRQVFSFLS